MGVVQTRLQHLVSSGNPSEDDLQAIEDHLRRVQLQNTRLQGAHDSAIRALQMEGAHDGAIRQPQTELRAELGSAVPMAGLHSAHAASDSTSKLQLGMRSKPCVKTLHPPGI